MNNPRFRKGQFVSFVGGMGIVKSFQSSSGRWVYLVEMPLGNLPEFGRVGQEASILLVESDLREVA